MKNKRILNWKESNWFLQLHVLFDTFNFQSSVAKAYIPDFVLFLLVTRNKKASWKKSELKSENSLR